MNPLAQMTLNSWFDAQQALATLSLEAADSAAQRARHATELGQITLQTWSDLSAGLTRTWVTALTPSR